MALLQLFACGAGSEGPLDLRVTTYNVLVGAPDAAPWSERVDTIAGILADTDADVIALQEPLPTQLADLRARLPGYDLVAPLWPYTDVAILYRNLTARRSGSRWLADGPLPWGFGNFTPRALIWAELCDDDNACVFVANTHFDNNTPFQDQAVPLVLDALADTDLPVVALGDFNSTPSDPAYAALTAELDDAFVLTDPTLDGAANWRPEDRIDHVFVRDWTVDAWTVDLPPDAPSDHFAISAALHHD